MKEIVGVKLSVLTF